MKKSLFFIIAVVVILCMADANGKKLSNSYRSGSSKKSTSTWSSSSRKSTTNRSGSSSINSTYRSSNTSSKGTSYKSSSSKKKSSSSSSKKKTYHDTYDDGYEAIWLDDDYDMDRYDRDDDYARGVDDAMDDFDW